MTEANRHGLSRHIPAPVTQEVRRRSRFGCVICRLGLYQYEHIDPTFENATAHSPDDICCLCASCHDRVTRGHLAKAAVRKAYAQVQAASIDEVGPPVGPLDFHDGNAEIVFGGLSFVPAIRTVVRYHGIDLMTVSPGGPSGEPGSVSAIFTDDEGNETLRLEENAWIGAVDQWDTQVTGNRIQVRKAKGRIALRVRLDGPGKVVLERLDMRFGSAHILATERTYAVGRHVDAHSVDWVHAGIKVFNPPKTAIAIEFDEPASIAARDRFTPKSSIAISGQNGLLVKPLGIGLCTGMTGLEYTGSVIGRRPLDGMRRVVINDPDSVHSFIGGAG